MHESEPPKNRGLLIFVLGLMTALSPFSIDMYLPAFKDIALEFDSTVENVSLSLSSYFVGLALGQLIYGPLLDRFGRKPPLYGGLLIYTVASLGCLAAVSTDALVAWRLIQALGGCAAGVAAMAMVRDLFEPKESAKVFSLLILILGASPLLAPTIGGYLASHFGWKSVFVTLALMASSLILTIRLFLPESHRADTSVSLHPSSIFWNFWTILKHPQFLTYAMMTAVAFSGLFVYLAGSPTIFLGAFGVDAPTYGWIFAIVASGFIVTSQLNVVVLRRFNNIQILWAGLIAQAIIGVSFYLGAVFNVFNLIGTVTMFFLYLSCFGFVNPNAMAMVMAPFPKNAGSAAALMGFLQMGVGALVSTSVAVFQITNLAPVVVIMGGTSVAGLAILFVGSRHIGKRHHAHG